MSGCWALTDVVIPGWRLLCFDVKLVHASAGLEAIADLDELLLRDIGAPDWLIGQAAVRRESDRQRLLELQAGRHVEY